MGTPLAFFITWRCYGTWLHGEEGSFDREHNTYGEPPRPTAEKLARFERAEMKHPPMALTSDQRPIVATTIEETVLARGWTLLAINVRTNHVHVVVAAEGRPEPVMRTLKSWCTRRLRECGAVDLDRPVWSREGSTVYLWDEEEIAQACWYVTDGQDASRESRHRSVDRRD